MAVCTLCNSLDYSKLFQEETKELSWLTEDISVLYQENRTILHKIKILNSELEEFSGENQINFHEDAIEEDNVAAGLEEKNLWRLREDKLRGQIVQQVQQYVQGLQQLRLQPLLHPQLQHQQQFNHCSPVLRHLWGHQSLLWSPTSPPYPTSRRKTKFVRLRRWLRKRMPVHLITLY